VSNDADELDAALARAAGIAGIAGILGRSAEDDGASVLGSAGGDAAADGAAVCDSSDAAADRSVSSRGGEFVISSRGLDGDVNGPVVPAIVFNASDGFLRRAICGGKVGEDGGKVCTKEKCSVKAHETSKAFIPDNHAMIAANAAGSVAFTDPLLAVDPLPEDCKNELLGKRPMSSWETFFRTVQSEDQDLGDPKVHQSVTKSVAYVRVSPMKTISSNDLPAEEVGEALLDRMRARQIEFSDRVESFERVNELEDPGAVLDTMASGWDTAVTIIEEGQAWAQALLEGVAEVGQSSAMATEEVDAKVQDIEGTVGERPRDEGSTLPGTNLWNCVLALTREQERSDKVAAAATATAGQARAGVERLEARFRGIQSALKAATDLNAEVAALRNLVGLMCTKVQGLTQSGAGPSADGARVTELESKHEDLARRLQGVEDRGGGSGEGTTLLGGPGRDDILRRLVELEAKVQQDATTDAVRFGDTVIRNMQDALAWVEIHNPRGVCSVFFDPISMLETITAAARSSNQTTQDQAAVAKAGHPDAQSAKVVNSFSLVLPSLVSDEGSSKLDKMKDCATWRDHSNQGGMVKNIEDLMDRWVSQQGTLIGMSFQSGSAARVLAESCITDVVLFWNKLTTWIENFHCRMMARVSLTDTASVTAQLQLRAKMHKQAATDAWELLLVFLKEMFGEFANRRAVGVAAQNTRDAKERAAAVLLGTARAHKFMKELVTSSFENHGTIAPMFSSCLFHERASSKEVERLAGDLHVLSLEQRTHQSRLDKLDAKKK